MLFRVCMLALVGSVLGCGGSPRRPAAIASTEDVDPPARLHVPELVWQAPDEEITVRGIGLVFRVTAPVRRLAIDEIATDACGDRMVHAMVVDRRRSPDIETILARAMMRAGCTIPDEGRILESTGDAHGREMRVHFDEGDLEGDWVLRAVVLDRAHRSVAIVSALRASPGAPERLFEIIDDTPGLEGVGAPPDEEPVAERDRTSDDVRFAFGVVRVMGEVLRIFAR